MKTWPDDKRNLILLALLFSMFCEFIATIAGQGARGSAEAWGPFLVIGVFQAVLLGLYVVLSVRTKAAKWLVAMFALIGVGAGVWWVVRTDPAEEEAIRAISLAQSACTSNGPEFLRRKLQAEATIEKVRNEFRKEELANRLHNALIDCN